MAYRTMKKIIDNENAKLAVNEIDNEEYETWKDGVMIKLDVFLSCGRITAAQYEELAGIMQ